MTFLTDNELSPAQEYGLLFLLVHCCRYGRFYGVTVPSNRGPTVNVGPVWTGPLHHKINNSGYRNRKKNLDRFM